MTPDTSDTETDRVEGGWIPPGKGFLIVVLLVIVWALAPFVRAWKRFVRWIRS